MMEAECLIPNGRDDYVFPQIIPSHNPEGILTSPHARTQTLDPS